MGLEVLPLCTFFCFVRLLHFLFSQTTDYFSCLHCFLLKAFSQHFPNLTMQGSYYYMLKIHICIFDSTYYSTSQILVASYPGSRPTKSLGTRLHTNILSGQGSQTQSEWKWLALLKSDITYYHSLAVRKTQNENMVRIQGRFNLSLEFETL